MQHGLAWAILLGSAVGCVLSEIMLFRMFNPPDTESAVLSGMWVAMPYLMAGMLSLLIRQKAALVALLTSLIATSAIGVSIFNTSVTAHEESERQVRDAVHPGEDPNSGPAGMRKSGAEAGATITTAFSIAVVVFVPPVQLVGIVIPTLITYGVVALSRRKEDTRDELENTE